jgi:mRNA-degrading endonuclease toxin of MazEF toxin-antitoxin module
MTTGESCMPYHRGDVVLVPFPFAERDARKTRPAVVVSCEAFEATTGCLTVAMVTSRNHRTRFDLHLGDWELANLLHDSWVRAKLATVSADSVRFSPGRVSAEDLEGVDLLLRDALRLGA